MKKTIDPVSKPEVNKLIFQIKKANSLGELSSACDAVLDFEKSKGATPLDLRIINDELTRKMAETRGSHFPHPVENSEIRFERIRPNELKS